MKSKLFVLLGVLLMVLGIVGSASAGVIDITSPTYSHFATFTNDSPYLPVSHISDSPALGYGDFGWHQHIDNSFPDYAGIYIGDNSYQVTGLSIQSHANPFQNFVLQGSNNSTTGLDGDWSNLLSSTVTVRSELEWQNWSFDNTNSFDWYRIEIIDDYTPSMGWAIYRWDLLAEEPPIDDPVIPEPGTMLLLGSGLVSFITFRKKNQ